MQSTSGSVLRWTFLLGAFVLGLFVAQNCGKSQSFLSDSDSSGQNKSNLASLNNQETDGGNGTIYDGKIFVHPSPCEQTDGGVLSERLHLNEKQADLLNKVSHVATFDSANKIAYVLREKCENLGAPKKVPYSKLSFLNASQSQFIYDTKNYFLLDMIVPNEEALEIHISANLKNVSLTEKLSENNWNSRTPVRFIIDKDAFIFSDSIQKPAFLAEVANAEAVITIINRGKIYGTGHDKKVDKTKNQAYEGGTALQVSGPIVVLNFGEIIGGYGSGGDIDMDRCCSVGDGGSNGGMGGVALLLKTETIVFNTGLIAGGGGGGASGGGAWSSGIGSGFGGNGAGPKQIIFNKFETGFSGVSNGGAGGELGLPGFEGGDAGNGKGKGGDGGLSIKMNGKKVNYNGSTLSENPSYEAASWLQGIKGRVSN